MSLDKPRCRPTPLPSQYSAELVRSDGGTIKVYLDAMKQRIEHAVAGVTTTIVIWRPDLGKSFMVETSTQTYFTSPITAEVEASVLTDVEDDIEWKHVGSEELDSTCVDVYDVYEKGKANRRARIWMDSETHIRLRKVTFNQLGKQVLVIEAKNVVMGPPPASVFELPPGLREVHLSE